MATVGIVSGKTTSIGVGKAGPHGSHLVFTDVFPKILQQNRFEEHHRKAGEAQGGAPECRDVGKNSTSQQHGTWGV